MAISSDNDLRRNWIVATVVAGIAAGAPLHAQSRRNAAVQPLPLAAPDAAPPAASPPASRATGSKTKGAPRARLSSLPIARPQSRITMDFRDAPIDQILSFFSVISGLTVIKDPGLQGTA